MKKLVTAIFILFGATKAMALPPIDFYCLDKSSEFCAEEVVKTLTAMNCSPDRTTLSCQPSPADTKKLVCQINSSNCSEPTADLMFTTHCRYGEKQSIRPYTKKLTLTWSMGFAPNLRHICVK